MAPNTNNQFDRIENTQGKQTGYIPYLVKWDTFCIYIECLYIELLIMIVKCKERKIDDTDILIF